MVVTKRQNVLVELGSFLLVEGEKIVLGLDLSFLFELLTKFLLFGARPPDRLRLIVRVLVDTAHPLETAQLLVRVHLVMVLVFFVLFLFFFLFCFFCRCAAVSTSTSLG